MNLSHDRVNNFDAMRLFGAVLVLVGHAYPLHGMSDFPRMWGTSVATLGVIIFFSLSGYLIAGSWNRDRRLIPYLQKRALRIFPALAVVVLLTVFVLGPAESSIPVRQYLGAESIWTYLANIMLYPVYNLPGVFETVPYAGTVNGSLWSLPIEFACYLLVPIIALIPARLRGWGFAASAVVAGVGSQLLVLADVNVIVWGSSLVQATAVWPYFLAGAALAFADGRIPLRLDVSLLLLAATTFIDALHAETADYLWWFVLPYVVVSIGSAKTPFISRAGRFGDFSYGLYLYAFPVQQLVLAYAPGLPFGLSIVTTLLIALTFATLSWHLVEKRALRLKPAAAKPSAKMATTPMAPENGVPPDDEGIRKDEVSS